MIKHAESHLDHDLTNAQVAFIMERFANRDAFFIETVELPSELGTVPCGLYGPLVGDPPIAEPEVSYAARGTRAWKSRLVAKPMRASRLLTVIAGPHRETCPQCGGRGTWKPMAKIESDLMPGEEIVCDYTPSPIMPGQPQCEDGALAWSCILYTAFGGPLAPQEPGDVRKQLASIEHKRYGLSDLSDEHKALTAQIEALRAKREQADAFWSEHALAY